MVCGIFLIKYNIQYFRYCNFKKFVKILGFVASAPDFYEHPQVINGASQLLKDVFGEEAGLPARSAIGVAALPWNIPVEIECVVELKKDEEQ